MTLVDARRWIAGIALAGLAVITGIISYLHALTVAEWTGSRGLVAHLIPLVADLMIVTASMALLDSKRKRPWLPWTGLAVGIGATVAMNVFAGLLEGAGGALVASLAPVALVVSLETLMWLIRTTSPDSAADQPDTCPHRVAQTADEAIINAWYHQRDCLGEKVTQRPFAEVWGISRPRLAQLVGTGNGNHPQDPEEPTITEGK